MKKVVRIIVICIMLVLALVGCDNRKKGNTDAIYGANSNPFEIADTPEGQTVTIGSYGYGLREDYSSTGITYDGKPIELPFFYEGGEVRTEVDLHIYIDGIPQPMSIRQNGKILSENERSQVFVVDIAERIEFDAIFTPITGKAGDKLGISILSLVVPSFMPEKESNPAFGTYHSALPIIPFTLTLNETPKETHQRVPYIETVQYPIPKEISEKNKNSDGTFRYDNTAIFELYQDDSSNYLISGKDKVRLTFRAYGGDEAKYVTTIYVNHQPVKVMDKECLEYEVQKGKVTECVLELPISEYKRKNSIYTISIPIGSDYLKHAASPVKSNSLLLINEEMEKTEDTTSPFDTASETESHASANTVGKIDELPIPSSIAQKHISEIQEVDSENLLIITDEINIWNINSESVISTPFPVKFGGGIIRSFARNDTILIAMQGQTDSNNSISPWVLTSYDRSLKVVNTINLFTAFNVVNQLFSIDAFAVSADGKTLAAVTGQKLLTYNVQTKQITEVADFSANVTSGIFAVHNISFANDDRDIAFYGQEANPNNLTKYTYGIICIDGTKLKYEVNNKIDNAIQTSDTCMFFDEKNVPFGELSSGEAYGFNLTARTAKTFKFMDKNESQSAYITQDGKKIVTFLEGINNNAAYLYKYRVYDSLSMKLLSEKEIPFAGVNRNTFLVRQVLMSADGNNFMSMYYLDDKQYLFRCWI